MSRSRAQVFRGPGFQPSKRERAFMHRQRVRAADRQFSVPPPKRTLAERVLPWRRRKAKQEAERREQAVTQLHELKRHEQDQATFGRIHRRAWRGIHPVPERRRLDDLGLKVRQRSEQRPMDHPQQRRMERELREAA